MATRFLRLQSSARIWLQLAQQVQKPHSIRAMHAASLCKLHRTAQLAISVARNLGVQKRRSCSEIGVKQVLSFLI